ncbi:MAG: PorT family protein, partial [Prevotellaceae bacterium]|nr:PorT family protein [Prevotellaceae bacterium]
MKIRNRIFGKTVILAALCGVNALSFGQNAETKMAVQDTTKVKADKSEKTSSYCPNEISFWAAGGWSDLFYRPNFGHRENKLGGAFGLGYSHYFTENWGFLIGAEMAVYRSGYTANYLHDNYDTPDLDPYEAWDINFSYRVDNYKEKQTLWNLNIPLQLLWQSNLRGNHRYYASAGFKLGIPISSRYESENATITGTGYVYHLEQWLNNETSTLGYGKFENQGDKGKLNLGLSYIGTLEGGIKWNIGAGNLYTGLYFDYGFNDVVKGKHDDRFVEYNSYERGDYKQINSVLTSQYTDNGELYRLGGKTDRIVEKVAPIAFGVKVRFSLGLGCDNDKKDKDAKSAKDAKDKNG